MMTSILVVEDENIVAKDIMTRLKNLGYGVVGSAASGEDALRLALDTRPDLVLMDIMLKGDMDGIEAAHHILDRLDIPVVYLTAYADEKTLQRAKVTEAFGYLLKPFEERELHITIEMALFKHTMERKLRESEQWLAAILKSIGDAVIATDTAGSIRFMNSVAETLTGWRQGEAVGRHLGEVFQRSKGPGGTLLPTPVEQALQDESLVSFSDNTLLRPRQQDSIQIDDCAAPIRNAKGEVTGVVVIFRDVTERRRAEDAVRRSQAQLAGIVGSAMDAIVTIDADQRIVLFNEAAEKVFGYKSAEAVGQSIDMLIPQSFRKRHRMHVETFGNANVTKRTMGLLGVLSGLRRNGEEFPIEASISQIEVGGDKLYTVVLRDITERRRMEEQLRQAQKMESIGTLASGIAHDFNNVLNNVLGFAMQLKKYMHDEAKVKKYVETIEKSASRGAELASQLLSFARTSKRANVPTDLNQIIQEVASVSKETFPETISVQQKVDPALLAVLGDHGELYQVLLNLTVNAKDAILPMGLGTITIQARNVTIGKDVSPQLFAAPGKQCVELKVSDTGSGIPEEIRDKIFDPFFTTKERGRGTGLGLSIVYNIIRSHHGTISIESEKGKGTTFSIYLPALQSPDVESPATSPSAPKPLVLIVDDEPAMQELGKELLEDEGYRVLVASDGAQAVELYRERHQEIALVILDLVMPVMDGGQAYVEMKKINKDLKAFFCTGFISDQVIAGLLQEESLRAISKPFRPDEFLRTVKEVLQGS